MAIKAILLKLFTTFIVFNVLMLQPKVPIRLVLAQTDYFSSLQNLRVNDLLPQETQVLGEKVGVRYFDNEQVTVITFNSSKNSNPHIAYFTQDNKIRFLQLTIPPELQQTITDEYTKLGSDGQVNLPKTKSEIMYAYPAYGVAYIVNGYSNQVVRLQRFTPKPNQDFIENEGKNFQPVPFSPSINQINTQESSGTSDSANSNIFTTLSNKPFVIILLGAVLILLTYHSVPFIKRKLTSKS